MFLSKRDSQRNVAQRGDFVWPLQRLSDSQHHSSVPRQDDRPLLHDPPLKRLQLLMSNQLLDVCHGRWLGSPTLLARLLGLW